MYLSYVLLIMRGYISAVPNAFSLGQRRPGAPGSGTAGTGARGRDSSGWGITPSIPATGRLAGASRLHRHLAFLSRNAASP